MKKFFVLIVFATLLLGYSMKAQKELPTRDQIDDQYKWNLKDFYENEDLWEKDFKWVKENIKKFDIFKGKLGNSADELVNCLIFEEDIQKIFTRLYFYSASAGDLELVDGHFQTLNARIQTLGTELAAASSFIVPEILTIPEEKINKFIKSNKKLQDYEFNLRNLFRLKAHVLSNTEERLLAKLNPIGEIPVKSYNILNDAELPFPTIKDSDGNDIRVSHGRYRSVLYSSTDRSYRERVYKATYVPYRELKNTFATFFNGRIKTRLIEADVRHYKSPIEAALETDNIPVSVYENLIATVRKNVKTLHRWAALKKKALGLAEFHPYDCYATLFPSVQKEYDFQTAKNIVLEALKPLGEEYINAVKKAFDNRWIDVYETKNKRSGAYSNSCACGIHPIILLNWNGTLDDVFTLAHEMGHNMHSYFTEQHQPFHYSNYCIFVAEVASTTNEALLLDYMITHSDSKEEKMSLIEKFLNNAQSTFYRQSRFADFEMRVHQAAMDGTYYTADELTKLFKEQYEEYWGPAMTCDEEEGYSWARIPHLFKYDFYVYQYATGFAAAQSLSQQIIKEGKPAIDRYLKNFLYAGNSVYAIDALKGAGVDMSSPKPIEETIDKMNKYIDMLEQLMNE